MKQTDEVKAKKEKEEVKEMEEEAVEKAKEDEEDSEKKKEEIRPESVMVVSEEVESFLKEPE